MGVHEDNKRQEREQDARDKDASNKRIKDANESARRQGNKSVDDYIKNSGKSSCMLSLTFLLIFTIGLVAFISAL